MNIALGLKRLQLSTVFFRQMGLSLTAQGGLVRMPLWLPKPFSWHLQHLSSGLCPGAEGGNEKTYQFLSRKNLDSMKAPLSCCKLVECDGRLQEMEQTVLSRSAKALNILSTSKTTSTCFYAQNWHGYKQNAS